MIRSLPRLLRNGAFRTAAACALVFLLAAVLAFQLAAFVPGTFPSTNPPPAQNAEQAGSVDHSVGDVPPINTIEAILSGLILAFLVVTIFSIKLIFGNRTCEKSERIERLITVTFLVMGTLFLITSGRDNQLIAPAFGLLGMIAGYLLGQTKSRRRLRTSQPDEKP